jgi:hypothetical protein
MYMSFGDTAKGIFYLILIIVVLVLIAKFWGLKQFFIDIIRFVKAIFDGIF